MLTSYTDWWFNIPGTIDTSDNIWSIKTFVTVCTSRLDNRVVTNSSVIRYVHIYFITVVFSNQWGDSPEFRADNTISLIHR